MLTALRLFAPGEYVNWMKRWDGKRKIYIPAVGVAVDKYHAVMASRTEAAPIEAPKESAPVEVRQRTAPVEACEGNPKR
jgi:hypothetical protein